MSRIFFHSCGLHQWYDVLHIYIYIYIYVNVYIYIYMYFLIPVQLEKVLYALDADSIVVFDVDV